MSYLQLIINICDIIFLFEETPGQQLEHHENMELFPLKPNALYTIYSVTPPNITPYISSLSPISDVS